MSEPFSVSFVRLRVSGFLLFGAIRFGAAFLLSVKTKRTNSNVYTVTGDPHFPGEWESAPNSLSESSIESTHSWANGKSRVGQKWISNVSTVVSFTFFLHILFGCFYLTVGCHSLSLSLQSFVRFRLSFFFSYFRLHAAKCQLCVYWYQYIHGNNNSLNNWRYCDGKAIAQYQRINCFEL